MLESHQTQNAECRMQECKNAKRSAASSPWCKSIVAPRAPGDNNAPGWQGATTENTGSYREYLREEQRRQAGCSAVRMQMELHHGLLGKVCSRERPDDRLAEHRHVVGLSGGDEVAVLDDGLVHVEAARILDVDGDRRPAGERPAAERVGGDEELGSVTDGGDRLASVHCVASEVHHRVSHAHPVRRM